MTEQSKSTISVPCNNCKACCRGDAITLDPALGDDPNQYLTEPAPQRAQAAGGTSVMLAHKDSGDCVYLGPNGCTIHGRQPYKCRMFDCRIAWVKFKKYKRHVIEQKIISEAVLNRGRDLLKRYPVPEHVKETKRRMRGVHD